MNREVEYNTELTKVYHTNYVRNNRAVVVMWAIFTVVFAVLNIVVFLQPQWIGDTGDSAVAGVFGLYRYCAEPTLGDSFVCDGDFLSFNSIINPYFKAASIMVAISCFLFLICIACFVLFCLLNTATVLRMCGWFQVLAGMLMLATCIIYPVAWDDPNVRVICGLQADRFDLGVCGIRWAYILAMVLVADAFILAILAFVLAIKQANLLPEVYPEKKELGKD